MKDNTPHKKYYLALTSKARQRQCGLSWLRERSFSPFSRAGYGGQAQRGTAGIPFEEFESAVAKIWHAFMCIPTGVSLLSPCNRILKFHPAFVYLHTNRKILNAIRGY